MESYFLCSNLPWGWGCTQVDLKLRLTDNLSDSFLTKLDLDLCGATGIIVKQSIIVLDHLELMLDELSCICQRLNSQQGQAAWTTYRLFAFTYFHQETAASSSARVPVGMGAVWPVLYWPCSLTWQIMVSRKQLQCLWLSLSMIHLLIYLIF